MSPQPKQVVGEQPVDVVQAHVLFRVVLGLVVYPPYEQLRGLHHVSNNKGTLRCPLVMVLLLLLLILLHLVCHIWEKEVQGQRNQHAPEPKALQATPTGVTEPSSLRCSYGLKSSPACGCHPCKTIRLTKDRTGSLSVQFRIAAAVTTESALDRASIIKIVSPALSRVLLSTRSLFATNALQEPTVRNAACANPVQILKVLELMDCEDGYESSVRRLPHIDVRRHVQYENELDAATIQRFDNVFRKGIKSNDLGKIQAVYKTIGSKTEAPIAVGYKRGRLQEDGGPTSRQKKARVTYEELDFEKNLSKWLIWRPISVTTNLLSQGTNLNSLGVSPITYTLLQLSNNDFSFIVLFIYVGLTPSPRDVKSQIFHTGQHELTVQPYPVLFQTCQDFLHCSKVFSLGMICHDIIHVNCK
eukprot:Em0008g873a